MLPLTSMLSLMNKQVRHYLALPQFVIYLVSFNTEKDKRIP